MISFVAHLPSVIFTRGYGELLWKILNEFADSKPIDPRTGKKVVGASLALQFLRASVDKIKNKEAIIAGIEADIAVKETKKTGHLNTIAGYQIDLARLDRERDNLADQFTAASAEQDLVKIQLDEVSALLNAMDPQLSSGSHREELLAKERRLERQFRDLEHKIKVELPQKLRAINDESEYYDRVIYSELIEINNLNEEIRDLKIELEDAVGELGDTLRELKKQLKHQIKRLPNGDRELIPTGDFDLDGKYDLDADLLDIHERYPHILGDPPLYNRPSHYPDPRN